MRIGKIYRCTISKIMNSLFRVMRYGFRQSFARFKSSIDASSILSVVAPISSFNGARFVAPAMGALTVGRAISQPFSDNRFRCESRKACSTLKEGLDIISLARFCA
jgi:hypothetical protein